ncbi:S-adenosyl-L-methionine-dependent methyltransferase, partial [Fragilariopsis cylindrus CCMP1102]
IKYVEFYSGIGGWTMALQESLDRLGPLLKLSSNNNNNNNNSNSHRRSRRSRRYKLKRLAALDHSDLCVQQQRNGQQQQHTKTTFSIERLSIRQIEEWSADIWCMSPPCQPHTRQHDSNNNSKDVDPRSKSFLKICECNNNKSKSKSNNNNNNYCLQDKYLPSLIFLENVIGFEVSNSFERWTTALQSRNYFISNFHLSPTQIKIPNDRPRYYCIAIRGLSLPKSQNLQIQIETATLSNTSKRTTEILPISSFLDNNQNNPSLSSLLSSSSSSSSTIPIPIRREDLYVPEKVLNNKSSWCFDIVCPTDHRSSCFTHSYGRYIKGTGSILYENDDVIEKNLLLLPPSEREFCSNWMNELNIDGTKLRYFSGSELARLFGFPTTKFVFPPQITNKQQWKLIGNSLNVGIASKLI